MHRSRPARIQSGFPKLTEKDKCKQDEEAQKPFPVKGTEFTRSHNETDLCSLRDMEFKRETVKILNKAEYEGIKSQYEQLCRFH